MNYVKDWDGFGRSNGDVAVFRTHNIDIILA